MQPGKTDYSFGVDVAELAGLPPTVVDRARALVEEAREESSQQPATVTAEEAPQSSHMAAARLTACECVCIRTHFQQAQLPSSGNNYICADSFGCWLVFKCSNVYAVV